MRERIYQPEKGFANAFFLTEEPFHQQVFQSSTTEIEIGRRNWTSIFQKKEKYFRLLSDGPFSQGWHRVCE
jgi:hypothetical protein